MATFDDKFVSIYENYVDNGIEIQAGAVGDTVNVTAGDVSITGFIKHIAAETALALTVPTGSGNIVRNYIRFHNTTLIYSVYATDEGATATALDEDYMVGDANTSPDGIDHAAYTYVGYVDVDDDGSTLTGDITVRRPRIVGRGA